MGPILQDEPDLVEGAKSNPEAFGAIYTHYFPRVYNYVRFWVGGPDAADDLTARIFEIILDKIELYNASRGVFASWLFAIAHNVVTDFYRSSAKQSWVALDAIGDVACTEPGPEETAVVGEFREELLTALARLEERERNIIALKFKAGLTNRHIAELIGLSESNVGVILYRAIRQLRSILKSGGVSR